MGIELDLMSVSGSELTCFCVGVEKYLGLVSGSKLPRFLCRGTGIDLILGWGSS